ncbi:hypothetical protein KHC33_12170 [Methanospirillum sp. J.3.6.1-F.2.7.3]|uniref:Uncharacterized protein n=1 Tax=Methanospirillum purgamenti TaxID=2834276 RepID=A0A8E7B0J6_9EURY|nr:MULTISPECIES: hypothetical protein [Methanospirillum]MDX8550389.1 hypothetical protein [Methanospirillum hungatei]QVV88086.1 hypothetical protein KHC33_12170 [Methanospirillum sp. J.3.6.1-F.2.7.3]
MTKTKMVIVSRRMEELEGKISHLLYQIDHPKYEDKVKMAYLKAKDIGLIEI